MDSLERSDDIAKGCSDIRSQNYFVFFALSPCDLVNIVLFFNP